MTHPHDDHDAATRLKPLISGYLEQHAPDDSTRAFEDLLAHREAERPGSHTSRRSFAFGALAAALFIGLIGAAVTLIPMERPRQAGALCQAPTCCVR
jgi:ferric-dicitrate binding protein FerR (iron transport regulator)